MVFNVFFLFFFWVDEGVRGIGINYGLLGNNLPPPVQVVELLQSRSINRIHIFDPNDAVLRALKGSNIEVILGVRNEDLEQLATDPPTAANWVNTHVIPYSPAVKIRYISAGNEVIPGEFASYVLAAMQNLDAALVAGSFDIPVTTTVSLQVLGNSYPPSSGEFLKSSMDIMVPIIQFLDDNRSPLLATVYPYFAYKSDPGNIALNYALMSANDVRVVDGNLQYNNLFDAMVDAMYAAVENAGGSNVKIVVSESGWPSGGNNEGIATIANARTYMNNLVSHVDSGVGTPRRPGQVLETYLFALFNENLKPAGTEQNFGLYHPDLTEVYHVNL